MNESIKLFEPLSKLEQSGLVNKIKQAILNGDVSPLEFDIQLKAIENVITAIRKDVDVKRITDSEAMKYEKTFELCGAEITQTTRKKYDYQSDIIWKGLNATATDAATKRKARESFLQSVSNPETPDPETGELIGPLGYGETNVRTIKFK